VKVKEKVQRCFLISQHLPKKKNEYQSLDLVIGPAGTIWVEFAKNNEVVFCFKRWRNLSQFGEVNITSSEEVYG